jgi:uncharacterized protein
MSVAVDVRGIFVDHGTDTAVVLLGEIAQAGRVLPIVVDPAEAQAIAIGVSDPPAPHLLTHDLWLRTVEAARGYLRRVDVVGLAYDTFLATLELVLGDRVVRLDARPSDCIALAVRAGAPIGVDQDLFDRVSVDVRQRSSEHLNDQEIDDIMRAFRNFLEETEPRDFRLRSGGAADHDDSLE